MAALDWRLVVLFGQNGGASGHRLLCATKEPAASDFPSRLPSYRNGPVGLLLPEVRVWGAGSRHWIHELLCSHYHVLILSLGRPRTAHEKVLVVEEVSDGPSAGSVLHNDCRVGNHVDSRLQSSKARDNNSVLLGAHFPRSVLPLLHSVVPPGQGASGAQEGCS